MRTIAAVTLLLMATSWAFAPDDRYDVLVIGSTVLDGEADVPRPARIGIRDGRIVTLTAAAGATADRTIDAGDRVVAPGFIDPHTHAGRALAEPAASANLNYLAQGVTTVFIGNDGGGVPGGPDALARMRSHGTGTNVAWFSGHGAIRSAVMGRDDRAPTAAELDAMTAAVRDDMLAGALGLSTGLYYVPGNYADTDEVVALAEVTRPFGGVYDTHLRDEGSYGIGLAAAVDETIEIARRAGVAAHISHIKALGPDVRGTAADIVERVNRARDDGLAITANQYPWRASGTRLSNALIPRYALAGSLDRFFERLASDGEGPAIRAGMAANLERRGGPSALLVTGADSRWAGQTLADIAGALGVSPVDAALAVVRDGDPSVASFVMDAGDIATFAVQPWVMTGSDGSDGHPRLYATYPKAWQDLVGSGRLSAAAFVRRSSAQVADTFGLCDRGHLRPGYRADLVVIDAADYRPRATYEAPAVLATGVRYALVNGVIVIDESRYTGSKPGQVINRRDCDD